MNRSRITHWLALGAMLAGLAACGPTPTAPAGAVPKPPAAQATPDWRGGSFVRAITAEPPQIDPQGAPNAGLSIVIPYLYDTLVVTEVGGKIVPGLAESWDVAPDGKTITMKLRSGVTFHDGTTLDAEAVRFTFQRFKQTGSKSPIYGGIQQIGSIEAADAQTVRFTFKEPAANFWSTIAMPYAGILSPASAKAVAESGKGSLAGSGPFVLEDWQAGKSITLKRNEAFRWGSALADNRGAPYLERVVLKVIPDAVTQLAALQAGEVDSIFVNEPDHRRKLEASGSARVEETVLNSLIYLGFNSRKAPFDDARVRRALSMAVDKDEIVKVALGGNGIVAHAPLPPTLLGYDDSLKAYALGLNREKAQALLQEAGFARGANGNWERNGTPLKGTLLTSNRAPNDAIAALLQSQLKAIGVPVEIQQVASTVVMQSSSEGKFDLLLWRYDWNDPDALNIYLGSDRIGSTNRVLYGNPAVDKLLGAGVRELDAAKRKQLYVEAQQLILQDAPWQPLYVPIDVIAVSRRFENVRIGFMGRILLNDAHLAAK